MISGAAQAQEPAGIEAVAGLEKSLVDTIALCEKSVVAIARVRKGERAEDLDELLRGRLPRGVRPRIGGEAQPTDPDYVPQEFASGVVLDAGGLVLTTYHALGEADKCDYYVWSGKRPFAAKIRAADPWLDLAVLKIEATDLVPIKLGDAKTLKKGQFAVVLGNPFAIARDGEPSAAWGVIANLGRRPGGVSENNDDRKLEAKPTLHHYGTLIQVDARLNLGTSGGALLNLKGELVGLTTALAAGAGAEASAGFAIPVDDTFKRAVEALKAGKKVEYGFLGVGPENLSVEERQRGKFGAKVRQAVPGTPAGLAGLKAEDPLNREADVITAVNDRPVYDTTSLILELSRLPVGERVELTVERGNRAEAKSIKTVKTHATLWKKLVQTPQPALGDDVFPAWRGLRVDYASAVPAFVELANEFDPRGCVGILSVEQDSPAWKAGLRPSLFISHVENTRVSTPAEFFAALKDKPGKISLRTTELGADGGVKVVLP